MNPWVGGFEGKDPTSQEPHPHLFFVLFSHPHFYLQDSELDLLNGGCSFGGLCLEVRGQQLLKCEDCIPHQLERRGHAQTHTPQGA